MSSRAKGNIGRWSRVRLRARRKAVLACRPAEIGANAANGLKHRRTGMARSEIAALLHTSEKPNGMIRDRRGVVALAADRDLRSSGSAENGNAQRGATLVLARGRIELENGAVRSSSSVRGPHCIADRNAVAGR